MPQGTWHYWTTNGTSATTTTAWDHWSSNTSSTATTATTGAYASNSVWIRWNDGTTTTALASDVWIEWVDQWTGQRHRARANGDGRGNYTYCRPHTPIAEETEEQKAARLEREAERQRVWAERQKEREAANARARALLDSLLDADQQAELEATGQFHVTAPSGRRYRIHRNSISGNVELVDDPAWEDPVKARRWRYCAHGRGADELPTFDHLAMQKLMLETDEDRFLATANRS